MASKSKAIQIFRYPGGKSKLFPRLIPYLKDIDKCDRFVDCFTGGGSASLRTLQEFPHIKKIVMNDLDDGIYNFWDVVIKGGKDLSVLLDRINSTTPNVTLFQSLRDYLPITNVDKAFDAFFFNRTTFSGIYKASPIGGYGQTGKWKIDCKFNKPTLIENINTAHSLLKTRIRSATNLEFGECISTYDYEDTFIYLDPPYYVQGDGLYKVRFTKDKHELLATILKDIRCKWALSYDDCPAVRSLYSWAHIEEIPTTYSITSKEGNCKNKHELLITKGD